jgi:hypothetical protein
VATEANNTGTTVPAIVASGIVHMDVGESGKTVSDARIKSGDSIFFSVCLAALGGTEYTVMALVDVSNGSFQVSRSVTVTQVGANWLAIR